MDYSLDLIKLREVYERVYRRKNFSFWESGKEYSRHVINVTFNYSNKEFNRIRKGLYIKYGYSYDDIELTDCVCVRNGELIAIQTYEALFKKDSQQKREDWEKYCSVDSPLSQEVLGKYFYCEDGFYKAKPNIKALNTVADIRTQLYKSGFVCDGIKFVRWKRSAGSGRVGKCLFIDERLYKQIHQWEMCGVTVKKNKKVDLAALESYISLTLSSIIDTIDIQANNILVIDDYKSVFKEKVMATRFVDGKLTTGIEEAEIENNIWDGQSLLDSSMFGKYSDYGMLLLRARFFKSCCFNTNLQMWFEDNGITDISQLNGFTVAKNLADIKLITTPSSIKYLKFGDLKDWIWSLDSTFGIVKHEKPTHFFDGTMVQCHYQLLNTIQLTSDETKELLQPSLDYLDKLKTIPAVLRHHIKYQRQDLLEIERLASKNDIVYRLLGINDKFAQTQLYHQFRANIIRSIISNLRRGHILVNGNYSTLFGNPLEMLAQVIGRFDGSSRLREGTLHSSNFKDGETILGSRSPHVTIANVLLAKNAINEEIEKYFNLTNMIVCVNSIGENILERLSGADYDSDSLILTNNELLIRGARRNYDNFAVPTKLVKSSLNERSHTSAGKSELDVKTSVNKIGEIINLSQELNSRLWDLLNSGCGLEDVSAIYRDAAQLDVMSNLEIDSAKKENPANNSRELKNIKEKYEARDDNGRYMRPMFFKYLDKDKGYYDPARKAYRYYETTMDYLQRHINAYRVPKASTTGFCKFSDMLKPYSEIKGRVNLKQIAEVVALVRAMKAEIGLIYNDKSLSKQGKYFLDLTTRQECVNTVKKIVFGEKTMFYLLQQIEQPEYSDISRLLFNVLFGAPNESFYTLITASRQPIGNLVKDEGGDIQIYGVNYSILNV